MTTYTGRRQATSRARQWARRWKRRRQLEQRPPAPGSLRRADVTGIEPLPSE